MQSVEARGARVDFLLLPFLFLLFLAFFFLSEFSDFQCVCGCVWRDFLEEREKFQTSLFYLNFASLSRCNNANLVSNLSKVISCSLVLQNHVNFKWFSWSWWGGGRNIELLGEASPSFSKKLSSILTSWSTMVLIRLVQF